MPHSDEWAEGLGWSHRQESLFEDIAVNDALYDDPLFKQAFDIGYFNQDVDKDYRAAARDFVETWLEEEYGVEFDEVFDWDAWRENYG